VVGCSPDALALVDNITVASAIVTDWLVRDVLENAVLQTSDSADSNAQRYAVVLQCSSTYNAVKKSFLNAKMRLSKANINLDIVTVNVPFPNTSHESIMEAYQTSLDTLMNHIPDRSCLRLACLDHVSSNPGYVLPLKPLIELCRSVGFNKVYVDAAHAPGMIPNLNVSSYGADIYAANLHKVCIIDSIHMSITK
jgi:L-cysteine desulfhydrase